MSIKAVIIVLTRAEALALSYAVGNSLDAPDCAEALFPHPRARATAHKAAEKLAAAIRGRKD